MCDRAKGLRIGLKLARQHAERQFAARIAAAEEGKDCCECVATLTEMESAIEAARNFVFTGKPIPMPSRLEDFVDQAIEAIEYKETHEKAQAGPDELERLRQENKTLRLRVNTLESRYGGKF